MRRLLCLTAVLMSGWLLVGCGGEDTGGYSFASASGVVTYLGAPLAGARLMAVPEKGPGALGVSDAEGKFSLETGTRRGVVVGKIRMAVILPEADSSSAAAVDVNDPAAAQKKMMDFASAGFDPKTQKTKKVEQKSKIPTNYTKVETSGLSYEIKAGSNELKVELK